jgi:predicted nuclease with TOPRIM domain
MEKENKKENIEDLLKKADELNKDYESVRESILNSPHISSEIKEQFNKITIEDSQLESKIMQLIKKSLDENDLDIIITPMLYNPENFMPTLGVIVKEESGEFRKKYTITITEDN